MTSFTKMMFQLWSKMHMFGASQTEKFKGMSTKGLDA